LHRYRIDRAQENWLESRCEGPARRWRQFWCRDARHTDRLRSSCGLRLTVNPKCANTEFTDTNEEPQRTVRFFSGPRYFLRVIRGEAFSLQPLCWRSVRLLWQS